MNTKITPFDHAVNMLRLALIADSVDGDYLPHIQKVVDEISEMSYRLYWRDPKIEVPYEVEFGWSEWVEVERKDSCEGFPFDQYSHKHKAWKFNSHDIVKWRYFVQEMKP